MDKTNGKDYHHQLPSLQNVLDARTVDQLRKKSDYEGLKFLAFHSSAIFVGCVGVHVTEGQGVMGVAARIYLAYVFSFLYMPLHETVHETAFETKLFNSVVMWITAVLTARPPCHFKCFHWAHHQHTGNRNKDPELASSLVNPDLTTM
jgi:fatty acid desaturase